eukprot:8629260-Karenia_brevis.AAC.1
MQIDQLSTVQKLDKTLDQHIKLCKAPVDPAASPASAAAAAGPSDQTPAPTPAPVAPAAPAT